MVVISIILFLFSTILFPYSYYMQRAYVERTADLIGQEWILSHKEVRNGKLLSIDPPEHANILLVFRPNGTRIERYLFSGSIDQLGDMSPDILKNLHTDTPILLESDIRILGYSGSVELDQDLPLGYIITAPLAQGGFYTGASLFTDLNMHLDIWYIHDTLDNGKMRTIFLRPYLQ
jgi:hypothetical protein